jgi:hypothetical protein
MLPYMPVSDSILMKAVHTLLLLDAVVYTTIGI